MKKKKKKTSYITKLGEKRGKKKTLVILGYGFSPPLIVASWWDYLIKE
jgi:hypothetical protein